MPSDLYSDPSAAEAAVIPSRYSIARRNRSAKFRFLNEQASPSRRDSVNSSVTENADDMSRFQRNGPGRRSLPGYTRTEGPFRYGLELEAEENEAEFDKRDLSIPGTPVSSRHVMSLKYRNQLAERDKRTKDKEFEAKLQDSDDPLLKFIESMKKLAAMKRQDLEQGIVREPPKPKMQTPPSPLPQSKFGYNRMGNWNGDSNLRAYTPLFQRSMTVKLASFNLDHAKPKQTAAADDKSPSSTVQEMGKDWDRPKLPQTPASLIINPNSIVGAAGDGVEEDEEVVGKPRRPLKHRSLSNADTFYEIRNRLER